MPSSDQEGILIGQRIAIATLTNCAISQNEFRDRCYKLVGFEQNRYGNEFQQRDRQ